MKGKGGRRLVLWLLVGILIGFWIGFTGGWLCRTQYLRLDKTDLKAVTIEIIRLEKKHKQLRKIEKQLLEDFFESLPPLVEDFPS